MENIEVLAKFLNVDLEQLKEVDDYLFEDIAEEIQYFIFTPEELHNYIRDIVYPNEYDNAIWELRSYRDSLYNFCFTIDEDMLMDYCIKNIEDILDCSSKEDFTWEDKNYIIFCVNG